MKDVDNPFACHYEPEIDVSDPLDPETTSYYQFIIRIIRWMVELGRIDIATELSSHNAYPQEGHFVSALYMMYYLNGKHNSCLALDLTYPTIVYEDFETEKDWTDSYGNVNEAIPPNAITPLGKSVDLRMMVDSDHSGDKTTRRSCTGFMIFSNLDLIQ